MLEPGDPRAVGVSPERLERICARLKAETESGGVPAASILVARQGKLLLHRGFGRLSARPGAAAVEADTIYLVASITKPVTVCGLMLLVEQGEVVLSQRVQHYLPEFVGADKQKVLVRHLLSHTSGLPDMLPENVALRQAHAPLARFVAGALKTPLLYEPGASFAYQSMGTLLAGEIVERITGLPLRDFLRRELFEPLGMTQSVLGLDGLDIARTAWCEESGDEEDARRWGPNSPYWREMGHPWGGLHATASDLAILLQTFLNGGVYAGRRLFSSATVEAMTRDQNTDLKAPWGLGWALGDSPVWNHFGELGSPGTFGHVGATGTVAWADSARDLLCVLLTTRSASHEDGLLLNRVSNMVQASVK